MKTIETEVKLDFETFTKSMEKGYSGGGDDENFTLHSFGGRKLEKQFNISQDLLLAYSNFVTAKQILKNQLQKEK